MSDNPNTPGRGTLAVHAGVEPDPTTGAIMTPVYLTSTYVQDGVGNHKGFEYSRTHNPTRSALQDAFAALEHGKHGFSFASGLAAMDTVLKTLKPGDEVISTNDLYGGSYRLFTTVFAHYGITFHFVDLSDLDAVQAALNEHTRLVWIETPTNPMMQITDIAAVSNLVKGSEARVVVDNTFASPMLQNPLDLGADMVMHSVTKYLGGHGTSIGGIVVDGGNFDWGSGRFPGFTEPDPSYHGLVHWDAFQAFPPAGDANIAYIMKMRLQLLRDIGACQSPFNAWQTLQGIETLHLRMERICANAQKTAEFLAADDRVAWVNYPGLADSPNHAAAKKYLSGGFGGLLGFGLKSGFEGASKFIEGLSLFSHLANIGDAKSLAIHPASTTHSQLTADEQIASGTTPDYIRLSLGIEDWSDLQADIETGLAAAS